MNKIFKTKLAIVFVLVLSINYLFAAKVTEKTSKEVVKLDKELNKNYKKLEQTKKEKNSQLAKANSLAKNMLIRKSIIVRVDKDITELNNKIVNSNNKIIETTKEIEKKRVTLSNFLSQVYIMLRNNNLFFFLTSFENIFDFYKRIQLLSFFVSYYQDVTEQLEKNKSSLNQEIFLATARKDSLNSLLSFKSVEIQKLQREKAVYDKTVKKLTSEEKLIRDNIAKNEALKNKLQRELENMMKAISGSKNSKITAEDRAKSSAFEQNRGLLERPVKGAVIEEFGEHPHHIQKNVMISSKGIKIATTAGANVSTIFKGIVKNIKKIEGLGYTLIVNHGEYSTVYSNLGDVVVKIGENLETNQKIGVMSKTEKVNALGFQIWYTNKTINPMLWLK